MLSIDKKVSDEKIKLLIENFMNSDVEKYILGRNENAKNLSRVTNINGFIDDFTNDRLFDNKPVHRIDEILNKKSLIVSSSLAIYPFSAINNLRKNGFINILNILDIAEYQDFRIEFMRCAKIDLNSNFDKYKKIYDCFNEDNSRSVFKDILNFRSNFDLKYMEKYIVDFENQYFEKFLNLKNDEVFVDIGSFDGKTSLEFIRRCPNYKSIYVFEPSLENMAISRENLKKYKNINFFSKGLSNQKDSLKFDENFGSASIISEKGTTTIEVDTLDNLVNEKVTFIKMDIEGWESMAIEGMRNHILNDHPKMAVSVYHKVDDFWKIPEQIFAIRNDYDIYMRHYTEGTDETVMFFIPKQS